MNHRLTLVALMLLGTAAWAESAAQPSDGATPRANQPAGPAGEVRLRLADDVITGSTERPKVLYILPWRSAGTTAGLDAPPDPELTELFDPLDPDAHGRETRYRERAASVAGGGGAAAGP